MKKEPVWVLEKAVWTVHALQINEHGGETGIRDENLLHSALNRPKNVFVYDAEADISSLAAAYCFGLAKNHPFVDGNKRVAAVITELFIELNGHQLLAKDADWFVAVMNTASGTISEAELAAWFRTHIKAE